MMEPTREKPPEITQTARFGKVAVTDVNGTKILAVKAQYVNASGTTDGVHVSVHLNEEEWTDLLGAMWQAMSR